MHGFFLLNVKIGVIRALGCLSALIELSESIPVENKLKPLLRKKPRWVINLLPQAFPKVLH